MQIDQYPKEVYQDFVASLKGERKAFKRLLSRYPQWAAFSNGILGDQEAVLWLLNHHFGELAVLVNGMDDEKAALNWLKRYQDPSLYQFCQATKGDKEAIVWLKENQYLLYVLLAQEIKKGMKLRIKEETFWYKIKW